MGHELLEHTADLGIRAWGPSLEAAVEEALLGLVEVMGVDASGPGETRPVRGNGHDDASRLVALLNEVVFVVETEDVRVASAKVSRDDGDLVAELEVAAATAPAQGISVKAATYHQLAVEEQPDGSAEVRVFVDV
ncbi:MAG TPA: archease [Actinomycetota bacterium]